MKQLGKPSKVIPTYDLMPPSFQISLMSTPSLFLRPMLVTLFGVSKV